MFFAGAFASDDSSASDSDSESLVATAGGSEQQKHEAILDDNNLTADLSDELATKVESLSCLEGATIDDETHDLDPCAEAWEPAGRRKTRKPKSRRDFSGPSPLVIILVGPPGSGKSTFAKMLKPKFCIINQDSIGSRKACEHAMIESLKSHEPVVIDRCNFDVTQRSHFLSIARRSFRIPPNRICAIELQVPIDVCVARVLNRKDHPTLEPIPQSEGIVRRFQRLLRPPTRGEGFGRVVEVSEHTNTDEILQWLMQ